MHRRGGGRAAGRLHGLHSGSYDETKNKLVVPRERRKTSFGGKPHRVGKSVLSSGANVESFLQPKKSGEKRDIAMRRCLVFPLKEVTLISSCDDSCEDVFYACV